MRRIYESSALHRDDDDPGSPNEADVERPQSFRTLDTRSLSRGLFPARLRHWAISVDVSTPRAEFPADGTVPFTVTMKNAAPFPVTLAVRSRRLWTWSVDGHTDAAHVELHDAPEGRVGFEFDRGERKVFRKRWNGHFQVSDDEWEAAGPGEYTIAAAVDVDDAAGKGLAAEATVRLV